MEDCKRKINNFCYICGRFTLAESRQLIPSDTAALCKGYFDISFIQNVDWVPSFACKSCVNRLHEWGNNRGQKKMPFGFPMIWLDPGPYDVQNLYVCINSFYGLNRLKGRKFECKSVPLAQTTVPHSESLPVPPPRRRGGTAEEYVAVNVSFCIFWMKFVAWWQQCLVIANIARKIGAYSLIPWKVAWKLYFCTSTKQRTQSQ